MLPSIPFWYLRHGQTDWNARDLSQGSVDIPLNAVGVAQAHAAAALLAGRGIASIVASPLSRAQVTAQIVGKALGLPVATLDGLRETRFGVQEGQPMGGWFDTWISEEFTPDGAEPFTELRARAVAAVTAALVHPAPVLIVAHGALFRALRAEMGLRPDERMANAAPTHCDPPTAANTAWTLFVLATKL